MILATSFSKPHHLMWLLFSPPQSILLRFTIFTANNYEFIRAGADKEGKTS